MTKRQIVVELHMNGEVWANESYPKAYLEDYLRKYNEAKKMSLEELYKKIKGTKGE